MQQLRTGRQSIRTWRTLFEYTACFAVFFIFVFSPFWLYGKSLIWGSDGPTQYIPELTYTRHWVNTILNSIRSGKPEISLWSLAIGLGHGVMGNVVSLKPLNFLYCLFPPDSIEQYMVIRFVVGLYASGFAFLAYGETRTQNRTWLILGSMIYLFCGFIPYYVTKHWLCLEMTFSFPLMLVGVDQIFDGKWSWLFIAIVFAIAMSYFYTLFMITLPAVLYAVFHFFELNPEERKERGGFFRILLRHVVQYAVGLCLAAVSILPSLNIAFESCRTAIQQEAQLFWWRPMQYLGFVRGIVDSNTVIANGFIALPSIAIAGIITLFSNRRKRDKLLISQILLYTVAFLVPVFDMLFSAFAGKTMRWCYVLVFWVGVCTACMLPRLKKQGQNMFKQFALMMAVYMVAYLFTSVWNGDQASLSLVMMILGFIALYAATLSEWGRRRKRLATLLLFFVLLAELTTKSYERFSPQYQNVIRQFEDSGRVLTAYTDNAVDIIKTVPSDRVYRVDAAMDDISLRSRMTNYGVRDQVNGVSNYYNLSSERITQWFEKLGNAHMKFRFLNTDLDQRTVLNALMGVEYVAVLEEGTNRVPYGYDLIESREKQLSDGTVTEEYLYKNKYALPLAYAYESCVPIDLYNSLPPNQKEQAMLQGVVLENGSALAQTELVFDDKVLLSDADIRSILEKIASEDDNLEIFEGGMNVKKGNYTVKIPVEAAEGEIYLQFRNMHYKSVNYAWEEAEKREQEGDTRLRIMASRRKARQWQPVDSSIVSVSCGKNNDEVSLLGEANQYYFGKRDVLLNLGYSEIKKNLMLNFETAGEYSFDSVSLICQPMDDYAKKIAPLQSNGADYTAIDGNRVTVKFNLERDAMACLSIPCSSSWTATVDGEPAEIVPANVAFMGVMLPKGSHTLEFNYMPKGLRAGAIISLGTLATLVGVGIYNMLCRRKRG